MPKHVSQKHILMACQMSFEGLGNSEIAKVFGVTQATVCNWRKREAWQDFEAELIAAYKEQALELIDATPS